MGGARGVGSGVGAGRWCGRGAVVWVRVECGCSGGRRCSCGGTRNKTGAGQRNRAGASARAIVLVPCRRVDTVAHDVAVIGLRQCSPVRCCDTRSVTVAAAAATLAGPAGPTPHGHQRPPTPATPYIPSATAPQHPTPHLTTSHRTTPHRLTPQVLVPARQDLHRAARHEPRVRPGGGRAAAGVRAGKEGSFKDVWKSGTGCTEDCRRSRYQRRGAGAGYVRWGWGRGAEGR